jgi:thioredoxin:protein disulfide reductase
MKIRLLWWGLGFVVSSACGQIVDLVIHDQDPEIIKISGALKVPPQQYIYKDLLDVRIDHPDFELISFKPLVASSGYYDQAFKETKQVYKDTVPFELEIRKRTDLKSYKAGVHLLYVSNTGQQGDLIISLEPQQHEDEQDPVDNASETVEQFSRAKQKSVQKKSHQSFSQRWMANINSLVRRQHSLSIQLLLIFMLGILLSLTPCIYPMVPVTIGILQAQGDKRSVWKNFLLALTYTAGLSTTFAIFGLLATCVGPLCGQLLSNKLFVIALVAILVYFSLSMLGLYEIRLPCFVKSPRVPGGSFIASFIFGAASGTFASPCVSPGLALVLSFVATLGSRILGFICLFVFGVGLSVPLLIIGTMTTSCAILPKAGIWMVEVKRLFGLLMIGVCLYYLTYALPTVVVEWILLVVLGILAFFYVYHAHRLRRTVWRSLSYIIGTGMTAALFIVGFYAAKHTWLPPLEIKTDALWTYDYMLARQQAREKNTLLFVDVWARYCSICVAINTRTLTNPEIIQALGQYVLVKIDASNNDAQTALMRERFNVVGVPAFMLIDPATEKVVKRWGPELYSMSPEQFIAELQK